VDLFRLLAVADAALDPFPVGGGITSLEFLSVGTPIVTLPALQTVMRMTAGMYAHMGHGVGVGTCVASSVEEYARMAVDLAMNRTHAREVRKQIDDHHGALHSDDLATREWDHFLSQLGLSLGLDNTDHRPGKGAGAIAGARRP
jgi:predicted O-linked N-acetylglucosamine transferase (SPINDLY family)